MTAENYYVVLGVTNDATADEIKSTYRQQAKELHPDRSGRDSEPFLQIQDAYAVLVDHGRREAYDRLIHERKTQRRPRSVPVESLQARTSVAEPLRPAARESAWREVSLSHSFDTYCPSMEEMFARWWGNFDSSLDRPKAEQLESLNLEIPLSPEQALRGGRACIRIPAQTQCPVCGGHGGIGLYECWRCSGQGVVRHEYPVWIPIPPGILQSHVVRIPLDPFGIRNFYLTVLFRVTEVL